MVVVSKQTLSQATIKRIPVYYRTVKDLQQTGVKRVRSDRLSKLVHIAPATIRRDFSNFGDLGRSGYGYSVDLLAQVFWRVIRSALGRTDVTGGVWQPRTGVVDQ